MSNIVVIDRVTKQYGLGRGATRALDEVAFSIPEKQFVSIMGPSGCGKTTLLNLIAGLDEPTGGRVIVDGRDLTSLSERERSRLRLRTIGLVFQSFNLLPRVSVERNVTWRCELIGHRGRAARARAHELLEQLGVPSSAWTRYPAELSGGEQQRVAMARALANEPKLLLADEPTGNLDTVTGLSILNQLRRLNSEKGMSIVLVTHDVAAGACGHRTIELRDGAIAGDYEARAKEVGRVVPFPKPGER